jgi:transcription initiation factor TFIID subunit 3
MVLFEVGRTVPNLDDLGLVFRDMGISIPDLSDYVCNVEPTPFNEDISAIPIPREHALNFLKPGSHEVLSRPVHIHEHLPPMQHIILGEIYKWFSIYFPANNYKLNYL